MEKLNFCTLFNSNYLSRGLVMYDSLLAHCQDFHLYVFAFDDVCHNYLIEAQLPHLTVISLKEFEDPELLRVKSSRSMAEYCWTCTASTILYSILHFDLRHCTYIDADLQFFADPAILIDEMGDKSVLITEHRYTPAYDQSLDSGKYCVQFVTFKNDTNGMKVLLSWRKNCIDWCYARIEDGKFGDQKYLDSWTSDYEGVHELQHLGGGVAPWNVQQYAFVQTAYDLTGTKRDNGEDFQMVFYHFHGLRFFDEDIVSFSDSRYDLDQSIQDLFYKPYIRLLNQKKQEINELKPGFDPNGTSGKAPYKPMSPIIKMHLFLSEVKNSPRKKVALNLKKRIANHYFYYSRKL